MSSYSEDIHKLYGEKLRVRVCGIHEAGGRILMVAHLGIGNGGVFWSPPGGGIQFGEPAARALQREFVEETSMGIDVGAFLFVNEYIGYPLHSLEMFFKVEVVSGELRRGLDPEMPGDSQIISEVRYMTLDEIKAIPEGARHAFFSKCDSVDDIFKFQGYIAASEPSEIN